MREKNCKYCEKIFEAKRTWQIFCSNSCRGRFNKINKENCFYCGLYAKNLQRDKACKECDLILSNKYFGNITDKFTTLLGEYTKKYKLEKDPIEWEPYELQELGLSLRQRIKKYLAIRRVAEERIIYLKLRKEQYETDTI